jgi:hypothetical protein
MAKLTPHFRKKGKKKCKCGEEFKTQAALTVHQTKCPRANMRGV